MTQADPPPIGTTVRVFRESPEWDHHERWWTMPLWRLEELYVATYDLAADEHGNPLNPEADIRGIRATHPDCVLVYV